jgi:hypothetical protein
MLVGCERLAEPGKRYIDDLGNLIGRANRIEIVEHSSPMDFIDSKTGELLSSKELTYRRLTLTNSQKEGFKSSVEALDPKTQDAFPACIPVAHHRIEFFVDNKLIDTMEVCFECGQVEWGGSKAAPPWSLYSGLESFILSVGMQPKRDWIALAAVGKK